jgi:hypothetical protein
VWVCREYGTAFKAIDFLKECERATPGNEAEDAIRTCLAKQAVLKLSFATFIFFAIHLFAVTILITAFEDKVQVAQAAQAGLRLFYVHPALDLTPFRLSSGTLSFTLSVQLKGCKQTATFRAIAHYRNLFAFSCMHFVVLVITTIQSHLHSDAHRSFTS